MGYGNSIAFPFCSDECQEKHMLAETEFECERNEFDRRKESLRLWDCIVPPSCLQVSLHKQVEAYTRAESGSYAHRERHSPFPR